MKLIFLSCNIKLQKLKEVDEIHAQTHTLISEKLYEYINENYGIELNQKMLNWGSIAPDILPKYKLYRHYYDNSIDYIIMRIAKIIFINRFLDFNNASFINLKIFSRDLGIISHYLSDFTCRAHADRWEFPKSLVKHLKYEIDLNEYAKIHEFKDVSLNLTLNLPEANNIFKELSNIKANIEKVVLKYLSLETNFSNDLDFALALNKGVFEFIIESIEEYKVSSNYAYDL